MPRSDNSELAGNLPTKEIRSTLIDIHENHESNPSAYVEGDDIAFSSYCIVDEHHNDLVLRFHIRSELLPRGWTPIQTQDTLEHTLEQLSMEGQPKHIPRVQDLPGGQQLLEEFQEITVDSLPVTPDEIPPFHCTGLYEFQPINENPSRILDNTHQEIEPEDPAYVFSGMMFPWE